MRVTAFTTYETNPAKNKAAGMKQASSKSKSEPAKQPGVSHGQFCWNELMTHDIAPAKTFYSATLGWTFEPMHMDDGATYWIIKTQGGHPKGVGGLFEMKGHQFEGLPDQWVSYISVDDVDHRVAMAMKAGAHVMKEPFDIAGVGRIACLRQPGGAMIYWMTPKPA